MPSGDAWRMRQWRRVWMRMWMWTVNSPTTETDDVCWARYLLAQALTSIPQRCGVPARRHGQLLVLAGQLDGHQRGHVWLLAYERHYREQIFAALAANHGRTRRTKRRARNWCSALDDREGGRAATSRKSGHDGRAFGAAVSSGVPMYWRGVTDDEQSDGTLPGSGNAGQQVRERADDETQLALHQRRRALRLEWKERLHRATRGSGAGADDPARRLAAGTMVLQTACTRLARRSRAALACGFDRPVSAPGSVFARRCRSCRGAARGFLRQRADRSCCRFPDEHRADRALCRWS